MKERKMRSIDLIKATGFGKGTISNYLNGIRTPDPVRDRTTYEKLGEALGKSAAWLAGFGDQETTIADIEGSLALSRIFSESPEAIEATFAEVIRHNQKLSASLRDAKKSLDDATDAHVLSMGILKQLSEKKNEAISLARPSDLKARVEAALDEQRAREANRPPTGTKPKR